MDANVVLQEGMHFVATADSDRPIHLDSGGEDRQGPGPLELVLMGLAGCTAMDVVSILRKKRQQVAGLEVKAHADRSEEYPKIFTSVLLEYIVEGTDIDPVAVERAIQLSVDRYCPVYAMLSATVPIETTYRIVAA